MRRKAPGVREGGSPGGLRSAPWARRAAEADAITLLDPRSGAREPFPLTAQLFGITKAALQCNCPRRFKASLATRPLEIPTLGYFDDFGLVNPFPLVEEALSVFTGLNLIFGLVLIVSKSERGQI